MEETFNCGPSRAPCTCHCPEWCEHVWDGPYVDYEFKEGKIGQAITCSECGMPAPEHEEWTLFQGQISGRD